MKLPISFSFQGANFFITFFSIWFISSIALSNGSVAPELSILVHEKKSDEYVILKKLQDITLELQLLEIAIKNRRDSNLEEKIKAALETIEQDGNGLASKFQVLQETQLESLFQLINYARRFSESLGVSDSEWDELFTAIKDGKLNSGNIVVHGRMGSLNLITLIPLYMGKRVVWTAIMPQWDSKSFWAQARYIAKMQALPKPRKKMIEAKLFEINLGSQKARDAAKDYYSKSYTRLYAAFDSHRYAILQRVHMARQALLALGKTNTAMGTPEEISALYNRILENLFSYGADISLSGTQRDFAFKGFLFAEDPEQAQILLEKLKFTPNSLSYNSPSS